jgi:malate synthase
MSRMISLDRLTIDSRLYDFVTHEAMPGTGLVPADLWQGLAAMIARLEPLNRALLLERDHLQAQIDAWHRANPGPHFDSHAYADFLREIGYLLPDPKPFSVTTAQVDDEIAVIAGPQLVVPVNNARYAVNAANARWGSLYDALYGTDAIPEQGVAQRSATYNPARGARVVEFVRQFLDDSFPLQHGAHRLALGYRVTDQGLIVLLPNNATASLRERSAFVGFRGSADAPTALLLVHHHLHVEIQIDRQHRIGRDDPAGISDVLVESAISTIQDFEDSVAAVDVDEKIGVYRNWLGLMQGTLSAVVAKDNTLLQRHLNADRHYQTPSGQNVTVAGRSLLLARNVGSHMFSDAIRLDGDPVAESIVDAAITALIAIHDLRGNHALHNSRSGSIYIVKPKMHGPHEVAFADRLFGEVEDLLGLARHTLKMGIMDEERRTSVNLAQCIAAAPARIVFINTGFLDRTGDEIHTSMEAGIVPRKMELKNALWLRTYEQRNVDIGLTCGLRGHAALSRRRRRRSAIGLVDAPLRVAR